MQLRIRCGLSAFLRSRSLSHEPLTKQVRPCEFRPLDSLLGVKIQHPDHESISPDNLRLTKRSLVAETASVYYDTPQLCLPAQIPDDSIPLQRCSRCTGQGRRRVPLHTAALDDLGHCIRFPGLSPEYRPNTPLGRNCSGLPALSHEASAPGAPSAPQCLRYSDSSSDDRCYRRVVYLTK